MALEGVRWRWRGFRRHLRIAARNAARPGLALHVLARAPLRPTTNAPWRLRRFGSEVLRETLDAAAALDAPVFVTFGTLLGWMREGGFIPHDDDVDLGLLDADWPKAHALAERMEAAGWDVTWFGDDEVRFSCTRLGDVAIDVFRFHDMGEAWESRAYSDGGETLHRYRFPKALVAPLARQEVHGVPALVPADPEAFLEAHYGDWRTPVAAWDYRTDAASEAG